MDDNPAERLFEMGQHLAEAGKHRFAALTFSTVAMGTSGATPRLRGDATFLAAFHLVEHATNEPEHAHANEGLLRARGMIQKGLLQAKDMPDGFIRSMGLLSLLERVHEMLDEGMKCYETCRRALKDMHSAAGHGQSVWEWWVYFRARMLRHITCRTEAIKNANTSASLCESQGDMASAAAFHLCAAQIHLTAPEYVHEISTKKVVDASDEPLLDEEQQQLVREKGPARKAIEAAGKHLKSLSEEQVAASAPLRVVHIVLNGLALLRAGHAMAVREEVAQAASEALRALERPRASRAGPSEVCWVWVALPIMGALLQHVMAFAYRSVNEGSAAWVSAERALATVGLRGDTYQQQSTALSRSVSARAERALRVALLDSAARIRLSVVNLSGAYPLIAAALDACRNGAAPKGVDVTLAAARLLLAEYYAITGARTHASHAVEILQEVERMFEGSGEGGDKPAALSDVRAMARTHASLLSGKKRAAPDDELIVSDQVRASALYANLVFHLRQSHIIPARDNLKAALDLVINSAASNEQLISNLLSFQACLFLLYENIPERVITGTSDGIVIAERAKDLANVARASRAYHKLMNKAHPDSNGTKRAKIDARLAMRTLQQAQNAFIPLDK